MSSGSDAVRAKGRTAAGLLLVDLPPEEEGVDGADDVDEHHDDGHGVEIGDRRGGQRAALRHQEVGVRGEEDELDQAEDEHDDHNHRKLLRVKQMDGALGAGSTVPKEKGRGDT